MVVLQFKLGVTKAEVSINFESGIVDMLSITPDVKLSADKFNFFEDRIFADK